MARIDGLFNLAARETGVCVRKFVRPKTLEGLTYSPLATDTFKIRRTAFSDFKKYMSGVAREGNDFKPIVENPDSPVMKYYEHIRCGKLKSKPSLTSYRCYVFQNAEKLNVSKEEYYSMVDEIAANIQRQISVKPMGLRKEFVENAGKIHKWGEIFATQSRINGKNVYHKFYDEKMYNNALKEYTEFVEKVTGKKVLIGCPSRMNWGISAMSMLNNPKAYKDVDYILISHGKNSSLITDTTNPNTWRFSDNDKSVWEFIEANVPKGKKVLAMTCETDGLKKAGKTEMFDRSGQKMSGIGNPVSGWFEESGAAKICESGIRHIIGHVYAPKGGIRISDIGGCPTIASISSNSLGAVENPNIVYYDLDFSKFKV